MRSANVWDMTDKGNDIDPIAIIPGPNASKGELMDVRSD
jgi:hypothetical protein